MHVVIGACALIGRDVQGAGGGKLERVARGWKAEKGALDGKMDRGAGMVEIVSCS